MEMLVFVMSLTDEEAHCSSYQPFVVLVVLKKWFLSLCFES